MLMSVNTSVVSPGGIYECTDISSVYGGNMFMCVNISVVSPGGLPQSHDTQSS